MRVKKIAPFKKSNYLSEPKHSGYLGALDESEKLKNFAEARGHIAMFSAPIQAKRGFLMKEGDEVAFYEAGKFGEDMSDDLLKAEANKFEQDFVFDGYWDGMSFKAADVLYFDKDVTPMDFIGRKAIIDQFLSSDSVLKPMPMFFVTESEVEMRLKECGQDYDDRIYAKSALGPYLKEDPNFIKMTPTVALELLVEKQDGKKYQLAIMDKGETRVVAELETDTPLMVGKSVKVAATAWNYEKSRFMETVYMGESEAPMGRDQMFEKLFELGKSKILKVDDEKRLVYGVVLQPDVADLQGDIMSAEDIEKTAHGFMKKSRTIGFGHEREEKAVPVESYISRKDFKMGDETITTGSWVLGVHVENDDTWQKIKRGEINSFSIGGTGTREPLDG